ncbi:hypothetical protein BD779DRAFT_1618700 [Infundibulicybe gibba]|nr:hypothetical protein BD779DRAFT_1618700 [Infundibulicybe gibba]
MPIFTSRPPLEEDFYVLDEEELAFFSTQTGIYDESELKAHILAIQKKAYDVFGYPCIRRFDFTRQAIRSPIIHDVERIPRLKISRQPVYQQVLALTRERDNPVLLDMACCFGNDAHKIVADGWPACNIVASDLRRDFWDYGHELFRTTPKKFPATFIAGDAFDPSFIAPRAPFYSAPKTPLPSLTGLKSLAPLQGHLSAIHASGFFHLFDEEKQLELAHILASLLSPLPGSVIFGAHGGLFKKGFHPEVDKSSGVYMFCHSSKSWEELWDGIIFKKGTVRVKSILRPMERRDLIALDCSVFHVMSWSVTRV